MRSYRAHIVLRESQVRSLYTGAASQVVVRDVRGVRIAFPLSRLRPFVSHTGVSGWFELRVSNDDRLVDLRRL